MGRIVRDAEVALHGVAHTHPPAHHARHAPALVEEAALRAGVFERREVRLHPVDRPDAHHQRARHIAVGIAVGLQRHGAGRPRTEREGEDEENACSQQEVNVNHAQVRLFSLQKQR